MIQIEADGALAQDVLMKKLPETQEDADRYELEALPTVRHEVLPSDDYFVEEVKQQLLEMSELGDSETTRGPDPGRLRPWRQDA